MDKNKRTVDKGLYESLRFKPCICCKVIDGTGAHHVAHRGGGGHDTLDNMVPVCLEHHTKGKDNFHNRTVGEMAEKFPRFKRWLINNGWEKHIYKDHWIKNGVRT